MRFADKLAQPEGLMDRITDILLTKQAMMLRM